MDTRLVPPIIRAVFDTNVVVSALIFGGGAAWLRLAWRERRLVPVLCWQTRQELERVLGYPKFKLGPDRRALLLAEYLTHAETVTLPDPLPAPPVACRDPSDEIFLCLAAFAQVPLVSGDADLTSLVQTGPVSIMSPAELRARLMA